MTETHRNFTFSILFILILILAGCQDKPGKSIIEKLQPVPLHSGFRMDGYWVWGGSVIKVDSLYHMFASRWKKTREFPYDYLEHSEIVRATSESLVGPYEFQEVVIGERDSSFWDSNMAHNPTIHKIGDEYVLFYNASDFTTKGDVESLPHMRRIGYAVAPSIKGPWKRSDHPLIASESNNPAVLIEGEEVRLMYRNEEQRVFLATSKHYSGPYQVVNDNVWPFSTMEDFYMFRMEGKYHFICEDNEGTISGQDRWGIHFFSEDGISDWGKYKDQVAYDHDIHFEDGSVLHCTRRERPQLIIENGAITGLCTAVYTGTDSWCQPVALQPGIALAN